MACKPESQYNTTDLFEKVAAKLRSIETRVSYTQRANWDRDIEILMNRYREGWTLKQIGLRHGLTRERVRQVVDNMLRHLRHFDFDPEEEAACA